jgi:hypothetical protein
MDDEQYAGLLDAARSLLAESAPMSSSWELRALGICIRLHELERMQRLCESGREVLSKLSVLLKRSQTARDSLPSSPDQA